MPHLSINFHKISYYLKVSRELHKLRVQLKQASRAERQRLLDEIIQLERRQHHEPYFTERHPSKFGYVRYADDFVVMVNGTKEDAETVKRQVTDKLQSMGLTLSEEKTKLTHWRHPVTFLGFNVQGRLRPKGVQITAIFSIPAAKERHVLREIKTVCSWNQLPEADVMCRVGAIYRGWCNYYRFASGPQSVFSRVSYQAWWHYVRYLARKRHARIPQVIRHEKRAGRLHTLTVKGRTVQTFHTQSDGKDYSLNIVPPTTRSIWMVPKPTGWNVDLRPLPPDAWTRWRYRMKRSTNWPPPTAGAMAENSSWTGAPDARKRACPVREGLHENQAS